MTRIKIYPAEGFGAHVRSVDELSDEVAVVRNIAESAAGGGIEEAPVDGKVYLRKEGGWVETPPDLLRGGWANYQDLATQSTLINIIGGAGDVKIANDGLGVFTMEDNLPIYVDSLYNIATQQIDLTGLKIGDMFSLRFDLEVETSTNSQEVTISAVFAIGTPSEFTAIIAQGSKKLAGSVGFFREVSFAAFDDNFRAAPAELRIRSDNDCTLKVNGYFLKADLLGI